MSPNTQVYLMTIAPSPVLANLDKWFSFPWNEQIGNLILLNILTLQVKSENELNQRD